MWRAYRGLIRKEFIQIFRDRNMLRLIFIMPVMQLMVLGYAVNIDVKNLALDVYDFDQTAHSRQFVDAFRAGNYFIPQPADATAAPLWKLDERFKRGKAEMSLIIPDDFSERLTAGDPVKISLIADGSDANSARTGIGYASQIVQRYTQEVTGLKPPVEVRAQFLYNKEAESIFYMVPGIVATLLTMVTVMLTSMAIVRERETGTLEQLLVTPISATSLMLGKVTAFAILGILEMTIALTLGVLWFQIPFVGSVLLLFALAVLYLFTTLGVGLFFSTVTSTQQQAMFFAWFFSIFAILTSGFFTPISNMPGWMQYVTLVNPMRFFMAIVRGIMMKGAGISELLPNVLALVIFGTVIFGFAALRFHKRTT